MKKIAFLVMGICASLMMWNCKGGTSGEQGQNDGDSAAMENPLKVGMPAVEKFVRVTADEGAEVFEYADAESPWRVTWMEDIESDMADILEKWSNEDVPDGYLCDETPAYAGEVLAVMGEEGDFYKVSIKNRYCEMESGYVKKSEVEDVEPEKVTDEVLKELNETGWIHLRVVKEGKYKGLVLRATMDELEGESFEVGVMLDGVLAFPERNFEYIDYNPEAKELTFNESPDAGGYPTYFEYPKSMTHLGGYDSSLGFNPDKLTDEQIERIVQDMLKRKSEYVKYDYVIPMTEGGLRTFWLKSK